MAKRNLSLTVPAVAMTMLKNYVHSVNVKVIMMPRPMAMVAFIILRTPKRLLRVSLTSHRASYRLSTQHLQVRLLFQKTHIAQRINYRMPISRCSTPILSPQPVHGKAISKNTIWIKARYLGKVIANSIKM